MKDIRRIDTEKLSLHPKAVSRWFDGKQIYPIYVEMSPTSLCNYHCNFCALDFINRGPQLLIGDAKAAISEMSQLGVKSIMFAGEGEPLMYREFVSLAYHAKRNNIDIALTTNGSLMEQKISYELLNIMSWIKVSLSSAVLSTFARMSGLDRKSGAKTLGQTILNIYEAVEIRNSFKHECDIGIQMIMTEENEDDIEFTVKMAKELGVDYIVLKQYSKHPASLNEHKSPHISDSESVMLKHHMETDNFKVIVRRSVYGHGYDKCYALPFWSYIASNGDVWACSAHMPDQKFVMGNIYRNNLKDVWDKNNVRPLLDYDVKKCRTNCRMDKCNEYLCELMNPNRHVNFI